MKRIAIAVTSALLVSGCGSPQHPDVPARTACGEVRGMNAYLSILSLAEVLDEMKRIYNNYAKASDEPGIASNARLFIERLSADDIEGADAAIAAFGDSCSALGM